MIAPRSPHTRTGKKLEVPVKRLLQGANADSVLDCESVDAPQLIEFYEAFAASHSATVRRPAAPPTTPLAAR